MSAHADAVYEFLVATAVQEADGRLVSRQPIYPHLMEVFGLSDPDARSARTRAVAELAAQGRVHRDAVRSQAVEIVDAGADDAASGGGGDAASWSLQPGEVLGRRARMQQYGGAMYGGIQPSNSTPNVFVYSDPSAGTTYGYDYDGWTEDGAAFLYTGEGRKGHQKMRVGNAAILGHEAAGRALRVFVADGSEPDSQARIQRYLGEFRVDAAHPYVIAEAPDEDGAPRTVFVFRLVPVSSVLRRAEDVSASGGAPAVAQAAAVPVDIALTPAGTAEAVPVEALGSSSYPVSGSTSTVAVKTEAELVLRFQQRLEAAGATCCRYRLRPAGELRDLFTDLMDQTANVLYEAKGAATREAVRMALGQLLDYRRHVPSDPTLAVLLPARPSDDLLALLSEHGVGCVYEVSNGEFERA